MSCGWNLEYIDVPSPNFHSRPETVTVDRLVIHATESKNVELTVSWLSRCHPCYSDPSKDCCSSAHYILDRKGNVHKLVDEKYASHHMMDPLYNHRSIAIENMNCCGKCNSLGCPNCNDDRWEEFSDTHIKKLAELCCEIIKRNPAILPDRSHIKGHGEIEPKACPCLFPWDDFMNILVSKVNECMEEPRMSGPIASIVGNPLTYQFPNDERGLSITTNHVGNPLSAPNVQVISPNSKINVDTEGEGEIVFRYITFDPVKVQRKIVKIKMISCDCINGDCTCRIGGCNNGILTMTNKIGTH